MKEELKRVQMDSQFIADNSAPLVKNAGVSKQENSDIAVMVRRSARESKAVLDNLIESPLAFLDERRTVAAIEDEINEAVTRGNGPKATTHAAIATIKRMAKGDE